MTPLQTQIVERPTSLVLRLTGDAGVTQLESLRQVVNELIPRAPRRMIIDCADLHFIASLGLGELVRLSVAVRARGGVFRVCSAHADITKAILKSRLSELMPVFKDLADAER